MNKKVIKYLFFFIGVLILLLKFFLATDEYRYILFGYDTPRVMSTITETLNNQTLEHFSAPQSALFIYLASAIKLVADISSVDILFVPLVLITFLGFFFTYVLAKNLFNNDNIAIFSVILYAISVPTQLATSSNLLFFISLPLFFILLTKYIKGEAGLLPLILASEAMYLSYPSIPYIIFGIVSIFFFFKLVNAIHNDEEYSKISRYADFFIVLPVIFILSFYASKYLTIIEYSDIVSYLNRTLGLWRSNLPKILYITIFIFNILLSLIVFLSQFYYKRLTFFVNFFIKYQNSFVEKVKNFPSKLIYLFILVLIIGLIDLGMFFFIKNSELEFYSLNKYLLKNFIGNELWRIIFFSMSIFFVSIPCIFYFFFKKKLLNNQALIPIILLISLIFTGILPFMHQILGPFFGDRGYRSSLVYVIILFAAFSLILAKNIKYRKYIFAIISIVFTVNLISSFTAIKYIYNFVPNNEHIKDMKDLEKTIDSKLIFYLTPGHFQSDLSAQTKFYSFSFIHSDIPFQDMVKVNEENLIMNDFDKFVDILIKNKTKYIITEPNFELEKHKKIEKITTKLYSNEKGVSVYFLNNINL